MNPYPQMVFALRWSLGNLGNISDVTPRLTNREIQKRRKNMDKEFMLIKGISHIKSHTHL